MRFIFQWGLLCLTVFIDLPATAQWELGGIIGLNFSGINVNPGSSNEEYGGRVGFGIGAVVDRQLNDVIDLHFEPMYLQKGGKIKTSDFVAVYKVNYIEIPAFARFTLDINDSYKPYAMAGTSIGFLTRAKYDYKDGGEQPASADTRSLDIGAGFGGGVKIPVENKHFFAEVRYMWGFINLNKENDESTVKNQGLQVLAGVTIPL
jgi:opacity protein-like surface antigen